MEADLMFHNVGQGLFYTGQIRCTNEPNFNFVYDCGGTENTANSRSLTLDTCIKRYKKYLNDKPIDLLVISHFHNDHTNGIAQLLDKQTVKDVIIPFYTFEERLFILIDEYNEEMTDDQIVFLLNPYQFFIEKGVERVIVMTHKENNDGMDGNNAIPINDLTPIISDDPRYNEIKEFQHSGKIVIINDDKALKKACWTFAFYADDKHKGKFDSTKAKQGINDLINAKNENDRIAAIKNIKASYGKLSSSQYNETSLIMVHNIKSFSLHMYPTVYNIYSMLHLPGVCLFPFTLSNHIHLLTGDFDFTKKPWNDVEKHFGSLIKVDASVKQIAHHGSMDNWDNDILKHTVKHNLCVIPYGTKNQYGHPAINVIQDILYMNDCIYAVTENQSLMMFYR